MQAQLAAIERLLACRQAQTNDLPPDELRVRAQFNACRTAHAGLWVKDVFLRQPFQRRVGCPKKLLLARRSAIAPIELRSGWRRQQRVSLIAYVDLQMQLVATDHTARRVDDIGMTDVSFGIERALYEQRAVMPAVDDECSRGASCECQLQLRTPSLRRRFFACCLHTVRCCRTRSSVSCGISPPATTRP